MILSGQSPEGRRGEQQEKVSKGCFFFFFSNPCRLWLMNGGHFLRTITYFYCHADLTQVIKNNDGSATVTRVILKLAVGKSTGKTLDWFTSTNPWWELSTSQSGIQTYSSHCVGLTFPLHFITEKKSKSRTFFLLWLGLWLICSQLRLIH